jgi:hypothetical protein
LNVKKSSFLLRKVTISEASFLEGKEEIDYGKDIRTMRLVDGRVIERFDTESSSSGSQQKSVVNQQILEQEEFKEDAKWIEFKVGNHYESEKKMGRLAEKIDQKFKGKLTLHVLSIVFVLYYTYLILTSIWIPKQQ